jgi:hypothetical protein
MVGSIDPRCEQIRGTHWLNKVAWLIGTRVAEAILASGLTSRIDRPDIWMQAIRSDLTKLLCHGGRPHMGPRVRGDDGLISIYPSHYASACCNVCLAQLLRISGPIEKNARPCYMMTIQPRLTNRPPRPGLRRSSRKARRRRYPQRERQKISLCCVWSWARWR